MARVNVDVRDLRRAAEGHWQAKAKLLVPGLKRDGHLLAFYAVECAMKARVLGKQGSHSTLHLRNSFGDDGHDLREGMKACRLSATCAGSPPTVCSDDGEQIPLSKLHQAWRYGAKLESRGEEQFVEWLGKIYDWLKEVNE